MEIDELRKKYELLQLKYSKLYGQYECNEKNYKAIIEDQKQQIHDQLKVQSRKIEQMQHNLRLREKVSVNETKRETFN